MFKCFTVTIVLVTGIVFAQRRVDPHYTYNRVIGIVPIVGTGMANNPKRPKYAPWPPSQDPNGITGYYAVPTDDGKSAVVEFVAKNRGALLPVLNDATIKAFEKGRVAKAEIESNVKQVRKDFNLDTFGMVM